MNINLNIYNQEIKCTYKTEYYSVRDNGSVFRHTPEGRKPRPTDNKWTFGNLNVKTGYLEIASERIHRIVAIAFHGEPPTKEHVVDHIDTNRQNNRPENLRWLTKLENIILNPITAKRIAFVCGSVEAFLDNPSEFKDKFPEPNLNWMKTITNEEAQISKERLLNWAKKDNSSISSDYILDKWIFQNKYRTEPQKAEVDLSESLNANAKQNGWKIPIDFTCCPTKHTEKPIYTYFENLKVGKVFFRNKYTQSNIEEFAISSDLNSIWIICKSNEFQAIKPWCVVQVTFTNNLFEHTNHGSYFKKEGAEQKFTISQGKEWLGGETFDDLT
jgi:hypothetical protein